MMAWGGGAFSRRVRDGRPLAWVSLLVLGLCAALQAPACAVRPGELLSPEEAASAQAQGMPAGAEPRVTISREEADEIAAPASAPAPGKTASRDAPGSRGKARTPAPAATPARVAPSSAPPPPPSVPVAAASAPESADEGEGYVLGEEDVVEISVIGEAEFSKIPARVGSKGTVDLPYVGEIQVAGLTIGQFRLALVSRLNEYFVEPQVSVYLREYRSPMVHVLGEVARPGPYKLTHSNTLMEVISRAGGFTQIAARGKVRIIRRTERIAEKAITVDAGKIIDEGRVDLDVALSPGDIIIVPESFL